MRLHRFYTTEKLEENSVVKIHSAELVHQIRRVFRLGEGDSVILFNGTQFDYLCKIDGFGDGDKISSNNVIRLRVTASERSRSSSQQKIYLCVAVTKKDTFEWIVEKATELGVTDIIPVVSERSEKKSLNETRLKKIAVEASEQSGRGTIPMVHEIMGLGDVEKILEKIQNDSNQLNKIAFHTEGDKFLVNKVIDDKSIQDIVIFIGPEGGWSPEEIDMFHNHNIKVFSLGSQVLRTETAVIATLSLIVFGK